jgi:serine O-acetyltransferase
MKLGTLLDADWARLQFLCGTAERPRKWASSFSSRFAPVSLLRIAQRLHATGWTRLAKLFSLLNVVLFGLEVPARLQIGPGLVITHTYGTVLGASVIGANVTIYQQVTLGATEADFRFDPTTRPVVRDSVIIAAGAKVLGRITLGTGCTVGANAVVLIDVPPGRVAVGVPARLVDKPSHNDAAH